MYPNWVHLTYCDPHAYAERYPHSPSSPPHIEGISIHAPKWSATRSGTIVTITRSSFNPLAHAGRDRTRIWCRQDQAVPIHTLTRGATCSSSIWYRTELKFQSTRPHGARQFKFNPSEFQHFMQPIPRNELSIVNHIIVIFRNNNNVLINRCRENTTFFAMLVFRTSNNQF